MPQSPKGGLRIYLASAFRNLLFAGDGNLGLITALVLAPLIAATGAAIDYGFAISAKSKLNQAAQIASTAAAASLRNVLDGYAAASIYDPDAVAEGQRLGIASFNAQASLVRNVSIDASNTTIALTRTGNTITATLNYRAQLQTVMMNLYGVSSISLSGRGSSIVGITDSNPANLNSPGNIGSDRVINESWISGGSPVNNEPGAPVYNDWLSGTGGAASPLLAVSELKATNPEITGGIRVGGATPAGQMLAPIISKKIYLNAGAHELHYWYKSTVVYPDYEPVYICGTTETEMDWVKSGRTRTLASARKTPTTDNLISNAQTARAGVYLTPITTNPQAPTPAPTAASFPRPLALGSVTRLDNSSYRIDICAYSSHWIERKISININQAGYFWLSFLAETPMSTTTLNGFYLGPVKLCIWQCVTSSNNSPWTNGTQLFSDSFESTPPKNDGDNFNLKSGNFPAEAGYESPLDYWMLRARFTNALVADGLTVTFTSDFSYGTTAAGPPFAIDGTQYLKGKPGRWQNRLVRRLLLLPGFYRLRLKAGNRITAPCTAGSEFTVSFYKQDTSFSSYPPEMNGCGPWTDLSICYKVVGTQFYDLAIGQQIGDSTTKFAFFDALSFEYLSSALAAGFPRNTCSIQYFPPPDGYTGTGSTVTPAYNLPWPGDQRNFGRYYTTVPYP